MIRFNDIIGQEPIKKHLQTALAQNNVSHAYLFCGDSGSGANAYQDFAACNLFLKFCDIFFSCKSIHCVPLSS